MVGVAGFTAWQAQGTAATPVHAVVVPAGTTGPGVVDLSTMTFDEANAALAGATDVTLPVGIDGLESIDLPAAELSVDAVRHTLAVAGDATLLGLDVDVLLAGLWDDAADAAPDLSLGISFGDVSLAQLNPLWTSGVDGLVPSLDDAIVVLTPTAHQLDPSRLPVDVAAFYPHVLDLVDAANLEAALDLAGSAVLERAAAALGIDADSIRLTGRIAEDASALFGTATDAQLADLSLSTIVDTLAPLAAFIDDRAPQFDLTLPADPGDPSAYLPTIHLTDAVLTDIGGAVNTFVYDAILDPGDFGSGAAVDLLLALDPAQGGVLDPPFGLDWLDLEDPILRLSLADGAGALDVDGSLLATLPIDGATEIGLVVELLTDSTDVHGRFVLDPAEGLSVGEVLALVGRAFPGAAFDAGALGGAVELERLVFTVETEPDVDRFTLVADTTIANDPAPLDAEALIHVVDHDPGDPVILLGLRVTQGHADCGCIRIAGLLDGPIGSLAGELELPEVHLVTVQPQGASMPDADLTDDARTFLDAAPTDRPEPLPSGLRLAGSLNLASLAPGVVDALELDPDAVVVVEGVFGAGLSSSPEGFDVDLTDVDITATLPTPGAGASFLPEWLTRTEPVVFTLGYHASDGDTELALGLATGGTMDLYGDAFDLDLSSVITRAGSTTTVSWAASLGADWVTPFDQEWLGTLTDGGVSLGLTMPDGQPTRILAVAEATRAPSGALPEITVRAEIEATLGGASDPSLTLTIELGDLSLGDLLSAFDVDVDLPIEVTLTGTTVSIRITPTDVTFGVNATAIVSFDVGGTSVDLGAELLLSIELGPTGPPRVTIGLRPAGPGGGPLSLADLLGGLPLDFALPDAAFIFSTASLDGPDGDLTAPEFEFLKSFYGCDADDTAADCDFDVDFDLDPDDPGFVFLAAAPVPDLLSAEGGLLDQLGIDVVGPARLQGTLPVLPGGPPSVSLQLFLPQVVNDGTLPDLFQSTQLYLTLEGTVLPPSITLGVGGNLDLRLREPDTAPADCTGSRRMLPGIPEGGTAPDDVEDFCYMVIPLSAEATIQLTAGPPPLVRVELSAQLGDEDFSWEAPFGIDWLTIRRMRVELGISTSGPEVTIDVGVLGDITVGDKDLFGSLSMGVTVLPSPPFAIPSFRGVRIRSEAGVELNDLVDLGRLIAPAAIPATLDLPNMALKNLDLGFAIVEDEALCLSPGLVISADFYPDYVELDEPDADPNEGGCRPVGPEPGLEPCALRDDGCFAGGLISVSLDGIFAQGSIAGFDLGPLHTDAAVIDLAISIPDTHFLLRGGVTLDGFGAGSIEVSLDLTNAHVRGELELFGVVDAYFEASAALTTVDGAFDPNFHAEVSLRSRFHDAVTAAVEDALQPLLDAGEEIALVYDALSGDYDEARDALEALGVTLADDEIEDEFLRPSTRLRGLKAALPGEYEPLWLVLLTTTPGKELLDGAGAAVDFALGAICDIEDPVDFKAAGTPCSLDELVGDVGNVFEPIVDAVVEGFDITAAQIETLASLVADGAAPFEITCAAFEVDLDSTSATVGPLVLEADLFGDPSGFTIPAWHFGDGAAPAEDVVALVAALLDDVLGGGEDYSDLCDEPPDPDPALAGLVIALDDDDVHEGDTVGLVMTRSEDDTTSIEVDWGDGDVDVLDMDGASVSTDHRYHDDDPSGTTRDRYVITVTDLGSGVVRTASVLVRNVRPSSIEVTPVEVDEGDDVAHVVDWTDPAGAHDDYEVTIEWGDGSESSADASVSSATLNHTYADDDPTGTADDEVDRGVVVTDDDLGVRSTTTPVVIRNVAPTISSLTRSASAVNEGSAVSLSGAVVDPGVLDTFTLVVDWGDGSAVQTVPVATNRTFSASHVYVDDNPTNTSSDTYAIGVTVTDDDTGVGTAATSVLVRDVAAVVDGGPDLAILENTSATVDATFTDVGVADTHTATIDWGEGTVVTVPLTETSGSGTLTASHTYGDNGVFTATVRVRDDDTLVGSDTVQVTVTNVAPSVLIDRTGIVHAPGGDAFILRGNQQRTFSATSSDPGSDDLRYLWTWGDGSSDAGGPYRVNPPSNDPLPSPSVQPRSGIIDSRSHRWTAPCLYEVEASVTDDDAGATSDSVMVVVTGTETRVRDAGYWASQYRDGARNRNDLTTAQLDCYAQIVRYLSSVYPELRPLTTSAEIRNVFEVDHTSDERELLERQLLATWLNFANGALRWDQVVDTNRDGVNDIAVGALLFEAEAARLDPAATRAQLLAIKDRMLAVNGGTS